MRAAFIHDHNFVYNEEDGNYYDGSGGAFDENLWNRYLETFESLLVVGRRVSELPNKLVQSSANFVDFHLIENASSFKNVLKNKSQIKKEIKSVLEEVDFAVIRLPSILGNWAFEICGQLQKPYVLEVVGDPFEAYWHHGSVIGKIIAPLERIRLRRMTKKALNVIYVTQSKLQNKYPSFGNSCGISNVRLEEVVDYKTVSEFYTNETSIFKIGLIGSFHVNYKGHDEALKALAYLVRKGYRSVELSFVGTGDAKWVAEISRNYGVCDYVKIVGAVQAGKDGVIPYLDNLHLYIHPSKTEGLPRVILEAMSRGKMCLGSNVGGTDELLRPEFLHKAGDWRTLANQIESILKMGIDEQKGIALNNLSLARKYLEVELQKKRTQFLTKAISNL